MFMLEQLITEETYQLSREKLTWREAIRLAGRPLVTTGKADSRYVEAMIGKVEELGPFIDLGKGIAIPHARPEDGVKGVGMSMLVLDHPVCLLDDPKHEIKVLICLTATDSSSHLKFLACLAKILRNPSAVEALLLSKHYEDIKTIIKEED